MVRFKKMNVVSKKEGGVRFVTLRGFSMGRVSGRLSRSQMSQADRLICPTRGIQCINEHIVVVKQRLRETSISVRCLHPQGRRYT